MDISIIISIVACILSLLAVILLVILLKKKDKVSTLSQNDLQQIANTISNLQINLSQQVIQGVEQTNKTFTALLDIQLKDIKNDIASLKKSNSDFQYNLVKDLAEKLQKINEILITSNEKSIKSVQECLDKIRNDNNEKLDKIQGIVDEKLQKTLEERLNNSFKNVIEQISGVNKAIGEIKGLANDVGSLKNVLANVKTKGIVGEVILGNLIREILSTSQFDENVITKKGSNDRVEFAIKMPGQEKDDTIYLPVDSKFPTESYNRILTAIDNGDKQEIANARKELTQSIKIFAKEISTKYIDEPNTTGFAIMFLPIEGLYAEVINLGIFEEIQNTYKVIITGPSTFSALLNALQMGFKTLAIQKKSADIFKLLGEVKTEFNKFGDLLIKTQQKVNDAGNDLESLIGTRTKAIQRKLKDIEFDEIPDSTKNDN